VSTHSCPDTHKGNIPQIKHAAQTMKQSTQKQHLTRILHVFPSQHIYYPSCPSCLKKLVPSTRSCPYCQQPLVKPIYRYKLNLLAHCNESVVQLVVFGDSLGTWVGCSACELHCLIEKEGNGCTMERVVDILGMVLRDQYVWVRCRWMDPLSSMTCSDMRALDASDGGYGTILDIMHSRHVDNLQGIAELLDNVQLDSSSDDDGSVSSEHVDIQSMQAYLSTFYDGGDSTVRVTELKVVEHQSEFDAVEQQSNNDGDASPPLLADTVQLDEHDSFELPYNTQDFRHIDTLFHRLEHGESSDTEYDADPALLDIMQTLTLA
jgi:Replication factor-A C terminal domain